MLDIDPIKNYFNIYCLQISSQTFCFCTVHVILPNVVQRKKLQFAAMCLNHPVVGCSSFLPLKKLFCRDH